MEEVRHRQVAHFYFLYHFQTVDLVDDPPIRQEFLHPQQFVRRRLLRLNRRLRQKALQQQSIQQLVEEEHVPKASGQRQDQNCFHPGSNLRLVNSFQMDWQQRSKKGLLFSTRVVPVHGLPLLHLRYC